MSFSGILTRRSVAVAWAIRTQAPRGTASSPLTSRWYTTTFRMTTPPPPSSALSTSGTTTLSRPVPPAVTTVLADLLAQAVWHLKRTFQPSILRKKRKTGFLKRQKSVGGRRVLKRRAAKGRWRLGGGI